MPVSPKNDDLATLEHILAQIPDPRKRRGRRHLLSGLLVLSVAAVRSSARSWTAIWEHLNNVPHEQCSRVGLSRLPSESTLRRTFQKLGGDTLDRALSIWMWLRVSSVAGRRVIALDDKTVRGARTTHATAPHLVVAFEHSLGVTVGQIAVHEKSNEIPTVCDLLASFAPEHLAGAVVTADAMHAQTDTPQGILHAGADYVFTMKRNQPSLYRRLAGLPWEFGGTHVEISSDRGRHVTRQMQLLLPGEDLGFPGDQPSRPYGTPSAARRYGHDGGRVCGHVSRSSRGATPNAPQWVQGHWSIENKLHWVRDVTYDEYQSPITVGNGPRVMVTLRNLAISVLRLRGHTNIAKANRHYARHPAEALELALTG